VDLQDPDKNIDEVTTTGDVGGYNIPAAFTKKGGSQRGLNVSSNMGYELTSIGKKEMNRKADRLTEKNDNS
jgi:hypothetical protein